MASQKKRICILGAGAAGLGCLKVFLDQADKFDVTCYEKGSQIGGIWVYTEETGTDKYGEPIHSSVYPNMITNLPKQVMEFPGFPYPDNLPSYFGHAEVLKYLKSYAKMYNLEKHIQLNTKVVRVEPKQNSNKGLWGMTWTVGVQPSNGSIIPSSESEFDAVIVCTGKVSLPNIPEYPGLSEFEGSKIHSHSYREPNVYKDQTVLSIGGSVSSWDITQDISVFAKYIYMSHRAEHVYTVFPKNVEFTTGISKFTKDGAILTDGRELSFDAVIFNTGYQCSFPFLSPACGVQIKLKTTRPLYKHTISITNPSLSFVSVTEWSFPFVMIPIQASFVLAVLEERFQLPSVDEMMNYEESELKIRLDRGWPERYLHRFQDLQFAFFEDLAQSAGIDSVPRWMRPLTLFVLEKLFQNSLKDYRRYDYRIIEPDSFEVLSSPENDQLKKASRL